MGIRECFVPREGNVFIQADYAGLELCTLAQVCLDWFGKSELANVINSGKDVHTALAADIAGISYEEASLRRDKNHPLYKELDEVRKLAKVANFGFPGWLGAAGFVDFAATRGIVITLERAKVLRKQWENRWPEMRLYFAHINRLPKIGKDILLTQVRSNRIRRCTGKGAYTGACNSPFQGLGIDAVAEAYWLIAEACYVDRSSILFGSRIVNIVHDEFIGEAREAIAPEAADELSRLMVKGASVFIPGVKLTAEPCVMRRWSKDAQTSRDSNGRLQIWG